MQKLILFDIDGTILNVKDGITYNIISEIIKEVYNINIPHKLYPSFDGRTDLSIIKLIAERVRADYSKIQVDIDKIFATSLKIFSPYMKKKNIKLIKGAKELILELDKRNDITLGLITGNFRDNAYLKLKAYNLDTFFKTGAFGDDHTDRNELPLIAIRRANLSYKNNSFGAKNTIIIGDTQRDIECARKNNIPVIAVATGRISYEKLKKEKPEIVVNNLEDTEMIINNIMRINN